jgi:hypothetical protein
MADTPEPDDTSRQPGVVTDAFLRAGSKLNPSGGIARRIAKTTHPGFRVHPPDLSRLAPPTLDLDFTRTIDGLDEAIEEMAEARREEREAQLAAPLLLEELLRLQRDQLVVAREFERRQAEAVAFLESGDVLQQRTHRATVIGAWIAGIAAVASAAAAVVAVVSWVG